MYSFHKIHASINAQTVDFNWNFCANLLRIWNHNDFSDLLSCVCILFVHSEFERIQSQPYWFWMPELNRCLSSRFMVRAAAFDYSWVNSFSILYHTFYWFALPFHSISATIFLYLCGIPIGHCINLECHQVAYFPFRVTTYKNSLCFVRRSVSHCA